MRPLTKRKYVAIWYINVENIDRSMIPTYVDSFKSALAQGTSNPWHELEVLLEAPVLGYFIPTMISDTRLEIEEIKFKVE